MKYNCMVVLDVGGTSIKSALIGLDGRLTSVREALSNAHMGGSELMRAIENVINQYDGYDSIAMSMSGQIDVENGAIVFATPKTIPGFTGAKVRAPLEQRFKVPVFIENDVNCAAIGEARSGAGRGYSQFLCITYGTGVGGAIVLDGQVFHGAHWSAGEIGHMLVHAGEDGAVCACGRHGCYEAYASTTALCRMAERAVGYALDGREIFAELNRLHGDGPLSAVIDAWCGEICYGLVSLIHLFNPALIVMGGGIMNEKTIIELVREKLYPMLLPSYRDVKIFGAELGNCAGMLGAWHLAKETFQI
ncbi:MAG: ROK family protein [Clostridia bacterium]